ncbi:hypothetical protein HDK77DRAFT_215989 [Phyllosticta capitalensis]|uniref:uncharacterized protein n=1 Tax=Phyllosticta capitalensis TaxID=121624 RepID=UPI0031301BCD
MTSLGSRPRTNWRECQITGASRGMRILSPHSEQPAKFYIPASSTSSPSQKRTRRRKRRPELPLCRPFFGEYREVEKRLRPKELRIQNHILAITTNCGQDICDQYKKSSQPVLERLSTISNNAPHDIALYYLRAEILDRKERQRQGVCPV